MVVKMDIPAIKPPKPTETISRLADFIRVSGDWHKKYFEPDAGMLSNLWYRGLYQHFQSQVPGVYRPDFTKRAEKFAIKGDFNDKRLALEREMVSPIRVAGYSFLSESS